MVLCNDLPTLNDSLNWEKEVIRLSSRMSGCLTPHVFAISGDWGSGKTSFMRQIQYQLGGNMPKDGSIELHSRRLKKLNGDVITVWFDAWRYQNEPVPIVALLHEMRRQVTLLSAVPSHVKKLGYITLASALDGITKAAHKITLESIPNIETIKKNAEDWERSRHSELLSTDSIRNNLQEAIKSLLPSASKEARVVIFIDDLDRCNPQAAIRLLEGLKIYLSIPKCIFVLGMNERILVDAISEEVSLGTEDKKLRASHYIEKICTDIYRLPAPTSCSHLIKQWIKCPLHKSVLGLAVNEISCLPPNPRRLKALANQWSRFSCCVPLDEDIDEQRYWAVRILIASYIHQFNRDIWERWSFYPDFWNEIKSWCLGAYTEADSPEWAKSLRLPYRVTGYDEVTSQAHRSNVSLNPGDIENFWIGPLILKYSDHLHSIDFKPLLNNAGYYHGD